MSIALSHLNDLYVSGLSDQTIERMGCRSVPPAEFEKISPALKNVTSMLEFPYPNVPGFSRYRLYPPLDKMKYFQKAGTAPHLYILPIVQIVLADPTVPLLFVEGEKKAGLAVQNMIMAIGIGGIWNWLKKGTSEGIDDLDQIAAPDRKAEICFDSDVWTKPKMQLALFAFGKELESRGFDVSIVVIPGEADKKAGFDDFVVKKSLKLFQDLPRINLKHHATSRHKDWWESWRKEKSKVEKQVNKIAKLISDPDPCQDPVDGDALLYDMCKAIKRFIVGSNESYVAQALWVLHAYCLDAFVCSPFLTIRSPAMQSGKTRRMEVIHKLAPRPLWSINITPAAMYRTIEKYKPTLLVDEADTFVKLNPDLRGILNASHYRATASVIRTITDEHEPAAFSTWCPKAIALIGNLPPTLNDRSILISMVRKKKSQIVERFSLGNDYQDLEDLRQKCLRWATDNMEHLKKADPDMPNELGDRTSDNWRPLLAIADMVGGKWPRWARLAALALNNVEEQPANVELLADIKAIFGQTESTTSADLVAELNRLAERPWPGFNAGKGITQNNLGRMVKGFGIKSKNIRVGDQILKGYEAKQFHVAFDAYLGETEAEPENETASHPLHPLPGHNFSELDEIFDPLRCNFVADAESLQAHSEKTHVAGSDGLQNDGVASARDYLSAEKNTDVATIADNNGTSPRAEETQTFSSGEKTGEAETYQEQWARIKAEHEAAKRK